MQWISSDFKNKFTTRNKKVDENCPMHTAQRTTFHPKRNESGDSEASAEKPHHILPGPTWQLQTSLGRQSACLSGRILISLRHICSVLEGIVLCERPTTPSSSADLTTFHRAETRNVFLSGHSPCSWMHLSKWGSAARISSSNCPNLEESRTHHRWTLAPADRVTNETKSLFVVTKVLSYKICQTNCSKSGLVPGTTVKRSQGGQ